jgi:toxin FitB
MFLLDTNVISELRKAKPHGGVQSWVAGQAATTLFISAISIAEVQRGVELTRAQDANKAAEIEAWLESVILAGQVLPLDASVCREWARLMHRRSDAYTEDALIAATARVHGLTVVTRNVRDFKPLDIDTLDPFQHRE